MKALKSKGNFYLIAVDANAMTRYDRIKKRQSETDLVSFNTFIANEEREMQSKDPNKQNILGCMMMADFVIFNNFSIQDLNMNVDEIITKIISSSKLN